MNNEHMRSGALVLGKIARKVAESAVHAAVFAYVSKKVTNFMSKNEKKEEMDQKLRIDESTEATTTSNKE